MPKKLLILNILASLLILMLVSSYSFADVAEQSEEAVIAKVNETSVIQPLPMRSKYFHMQLSGNGISSAPVVGYTQEEKELLAKSPAEAFFRSLLLPGWGQRFADRKYRGAIFTGVEAALWSGVIISRLLYADGTDEYEAFATQHAGISGNPSHEFFVDIGNYNTREEFNEVRRQNRQYDAQYFGSSTYWSWDSDANRRKFKDIRISADQHKNRVWYFVGGLVLNRVLSAIDAGRGFSNRQKAIRASKVEVGYDAKLGGPALVWTGSIFK